MTNIKSVCPDCETFIEVRDDWYPSYVIRNRKYVDANLYVCDTVEFMDNPFAKYEVVLSFWGNDDYGVEKRIEVRTFEECVKMYRKLRKFMNKIKKMNVMDLDRYLYRNGFKPF